MVAVVPVVVVVVVFVLSLKPLFDAGPHTKPILIIILNSYNRSKASPVLRENII